MLQSIRDKSQGLFAYIIIGLITIPFMLWGIQSYLGGGGKQVVATVNGDDITSTELQRAIQLQQRRLRAMFGTNVPPAMLEGKAMRQQVLNSLIRQRLMAQYSRSAGFRASDRQVVEKIQSEPAFQVDGKFSAERYDQLLKAQRMNKAGYEHDVRLQLQHDQFRQALADSAFLPPGMGKRYLALEQQQRDVAYVLIDPASFEDRVKVSEEEVQEYYKKHSREFLTDERVKLDYVVLDEKSLAKQVDVSDEALRKLYEEERDAYATPETRKASHIVIKLPANATDDQVEQAKAKARALLSQLEEGASFESLAKEHSDDKLSAKNGGNLGFIAPGDMDPVFEKTLFGLEVGKVSQPVRTAQGIELIKLLEIKPRKQQSFEEAKAAVEKEYRAREASRIAVDKTEQLVTVSYESPDSLDPVADATGLKIQSTDWLTRKQATGIARDPKVLAAAFSQTVLDGHNSDVIELADGRQIVVRVKEHEAAQPKPLAEVHDEIVARIKHDKARKLARQAGESKLAELRSGATLESVAKALGTDVKKPGLVDRRSKQVAGDVLDLLFKMPAPSKGKPSFDGHVLSDGSYVLLEVDQVKTPKIELTDSDRVRLSGVEAGYKQREFDAVYRAIESRAKVSVQAQDKSQDQ